MLSTESDNSIKLDFDTVSLFGGKLLFALLTYPTVSLLCHCGLPIRNEANTEVVFSLTESTEETIDSLNPVIIWFILSIFSAVLVTIVLTMRHDSNTTFNYDILEQLQNSNKIL